MEIPLSSIRFLPYKRISGYSKLPKSPKNRLVIIMAEEQDIYGPAELVNSSGNSRGAIKLGT